MKKIFSLFFVFVISGCLQTNFFLINKNYNFNKRDKILQTVQNELPQILEEIPFGKEELYGFRNRNEFLNTTVDEPFQFYTLTDNKLKNTSSYRVPIIVENEFRALATVEYIKDTLHIVDFGANILAKEIQGVCKENTKFKFIGILRIYNIHSDFLVMSNKQENLFIPLTSAKLYLYSVGISDIEKYYTINQIINLL